MPGLVRHDLPDLMLTGECLADNDRTLTLTMMVDCRSALQKERQAKAREVVQAGGAQMIPVENKQAFADAVQPMYAKFATTPELKSLVERIQATK